MKKIIFILTIIISTQLSYGQQTGTLKTIKVQGAGGSGSTAIAQYLKSGYAVIVDSTGTGTDADPKIYTLAIDTTLLKDTTYLKAPIYREGDTIKFKSDSIRTILNYRDNALDTGTYTNSTLIPKGYFNDRLAGLPTSIPELQEIVDISKNSNPLYNSLFVTNLRSFTFNEYVNKALFFTLNSRTPGTDSSNSITMFSPTTTLLGGIRRTTTKQNAYPGNWNSTHELLFPLGHISVTYSDTMPRANGVLAVSVNGIKADSSGNITINNGGSSGISKIIKGFGQTQVNDSTTSNDTTLMATVSRLVNDSSNLKSAIDLKVDKSDSTIAARVTALNVRTSNVPNVNATIPSNIVQSATYRFVSDTEKATWNGKANDADVVKIMGDVNVLGTKTFRGLNATSSDGSKNSLLSTQSNGHLYIQAGSGVTYFIAAGINNQFRTFDNTTIGKYAIYDPSYVAFYDGNINTAVVRSSGISTLTGLSLSTIVNATGNFVTRNTTTGNLTERTPAQTLTDIGAQPLLVSGNTIKTLNGNPLIGSGNISISAGTGSNNADSLGSEPASFYLTTVAAATSYEAKFAKGTAFNKDFGVTTGSVADGKRVMDSIAAVKVLLSAKRDITGGGSLTGDIPTYATQEAAVTGGLIDKSLFKLPPDVNGNRLLAIVDTSITFNYTVNNTGVGLAPSFTISTLADSVFTMSVDWGDGTTVNYTTPSQTFTPTHIYSTGGTYIVKLGVSNPYKTLNVTIDGNNINNVVSFKNIEYFKNLRSFLAGANLLVTDSVNAMKFPPVKSGQIQLLDFSYNGLTKFTPANPISPAIYSLNVGYNALTVTEVNNTLIWLNGLTINAGEKFLYIKQATASAPTGTGATALTALEAKGWVIDHD